MTIGLANDPFGQSCQISGNSSFSNVTSNISGLAVDCEDIPVISARVNDFFSGDAITGTDVQLSRQEAGATITEIAALDAEGVAQFEVPLNAGRVSFSVDPASYGAQSVVIEGPEDASAANANIFVQPSDLTTTFSNATGGTISLDGDALVELPTDGFVDSAGNLATGDVSLELTVIDPSRDSDLMPGDYQAVDPQTGETSSIESFGAMDLTFEDAGGNALDLAAGKTATLRIPVANRVEGQAPASIPLYYYDEDAGYWIEEGSATLTTLASGEQVYEGSVSHFTTWNADIRTQTVRATGCVVDGDGQPLANIRIRSEGVDYIGSSRAISDNSGVFSIPVRINSTLRISTLGTAQSRTIVIDSNGEDFTFADAADPSSCLTISSTELGAGSATITLTWGENPRDLDSQLFGVPNTPTESDTAFRIYYANRTVTFENTTLFLDVDDTSSFGPEIVTVPAFPYAGTYTYAVDLFSGTGSIQSSPARVELNLGGNVQVFGPPAGDPTACWAVAEFVVDAEGNITTNELARWETDGFCRQGPQTEANKGISPFPPRAPKVSAE